MMEGPVKDQLRHQLRDNMVQGCGSLLQKVEPIVKIWYYVPNS